jgi:hypothetical protein
VALSFALVPAFGKLGAAASALITAAIINDLLDRRRLEPEISIWISSRAQTSD